MKHSRIKVSAVQYLNTKPYLSAFEHLQADWPLDVSLETPAQCATVMREGNVSMGLVPVAEVPSLPRYQPLSRWGIAADGEVASVLLVSDFPIDMITLVYDDEQSRTSNLLARILLREYEGFEVTFKNFSTEARRVDDDQEFAAFVVIGDRALTTTRDFAYRYDLAALWKKHTGLPFVFAQWLVHPDLPDDFLEAVDQAFEGSVSSIERQVGQWAAAYPDVDILYYLTRNIRYRLNEQELAGLRHFYGHMQDHLVFPKFMKT